jgi:peptidoglycan/LPS O-acetylase OafA/YrhL
VADFGKTPATSPGRSPHHPAIEGLRAIAVLAVVLAHALVPGFSGGFIGVDVFFVISGFLICRLLFDELAREGKIDLIRFWARRMRRLLPNATLVLLAVLLAGLVLVPGFMRAGVAKDITMSALQVSNYHFARTAVDYFAQDDQQSLVLHFWSLAVEEQFYIVWPALLALLCVVVGRHALSVSRWLLVIICVASLAGMLYAITLSQPVAFFHSWSRAWQLGIGGILAIAFNAGVGQAGGRLLPWLSVMGWVGLVAIFASIHFLDETMLYPGLPALWPTLAAAAVVAAVTLPRVTSGDDSWGVGKALSAAPLRWLGARSYSWYLWHWPLLILAEAAYPDLAGVRMIGASAALIVAAAMFTFIEDPIRRGERLAIPAGSTLLAGLASILVVVAAAAGFARVPHTGDANAVTRNALMTDANADLGRNYYDKCHLPVEATKQPDCEYGTRGGKLRVVLFGDSHAAQWFEGLDAAATAEGWTLRSWTKSSCPASDVSIWYPPRRTSFHECDTWRSAQMAALTGPNRPDAVVLSNSLNYTGWLERPGAPGRLLLKGEAEGVMRAGLARTIQTLVDAGVPVIVVRDTPRMIRSIARCYVSAGGSACDLIRERALPRQGGDVEVARAFPPAAGVRLLDLTDRICEPNVCRVVRDGKVIWRDSHHVRANFAKDQSEHFQRLLRDIAGIKPN